MRPFRRGNKRTERVIDLAADGQDPKPRVHVCDDNASVTQVLDMMLSLEGWTVDITTNGAD